jgi:uncharacterized membrane protein
VVMEVVLGIDNLIFISIITNKLPPEQQLRRGASASAWRSARGRLSVWGGGGGGVGNTGGGGGGGGPEAGCKKRGEGEKKM